MLRYAELHAKTNFSFLEGASHPDELVAQARALGYSALAITDRNSLAGVVRAHGAAKEAGIKLIVGAEITPLDAPPVVLLATDRAAYGRLCRLITKGRRAAPKGECRLTMEDVAEHAEGLIALIGAGGWGLGAGVNTSSADRASILQFPTSNLQPLTSNLSPPQSPAPSPQSLFPGRCYLLAELHHGPDDDGKLDRLAATAKSLGIPLVAAGDVHYHVPARQDLCDVLAATRHGVTVAELGARRFANAERHLKPLDELARRYAKYPDALARTIEIADRCTFSLDELRYEYPLELAPPGETPLAYLTRLTWEGARTRYGDDVPERVRRLLEHELQLIAELRYEPYFLTVWDLVRFARSRGILCQGRGSAANSAVCFVLGITSVDPSRIDVLFERFVSRERNEAPDIDVDFEHERREEVLQYLYEKYGRERAGLTAVTITYRPRSAIRDVGRALGFGAEIIGKLAKSLDRHGGDVADVLEQRCREVGLLPGRLGDCGSNEERVGTFLTQRAQRFRRGRGEDREEEELLTPDDNSSVPPCFRVSEDGSALSSATSAQPSASSALKNNQLNSAQTAADVHQLIRLTLELLSFPRHLSQHVGGMVMTRGPLCELAPIENAAMADRTVIEWNKDDLDELGILKVDVLALGMLTAIRKCFALVEQSTGRALSLATVPAEDTAVYDMICRADTMGVFQIESRAQMSMLPRLKPRCFYDLVIEVAIVRPGPIQGDMVHPYLRRRAGEEPVEYPSDAIREVLEKTLGVPLFQEQAMRLAVVAAGFTPGEADQLRRAMGAWRRTGVIERFREKLLCGMTERGLSPEFAERVFKQIQGFGEYGFPESHAASFALLVYVSAWLKCYYPAAFAAAVINSQPMGFYAPAQLIRDAIGHGVEVLPADVNKSDWDCTLEPIKTSNGSGKIETRRHGDTEGGNEECKMKNEKWNAGNPSIFHSSFCILPSSDSLRASVSPRFDFESAIRLGFRLVVGLPRIVVDAVVAARKSGAFRSFDDFVRRTGLGQAALKRLAEADAFRSLGLDRREALWLALGKEKKARPLPLFDALEATDVGDGDRSPEALPEITDEEQVIADYLTGGLSLRAHPISFHRERLAALGVVTAAALAAAENDSRVRVAGLVLLRQRPATAKGITFVTLEDETGTANLVVHPGVWQRFHAVAHRSAAVIARGKLESRSGVIHVIVERLDDLPRQLAELRVQSRDFR
ncbi:MAG: error-prone DNA polymerase [Planctomycetota bacterium]|nr:MAG: error-prone DNA polymerase [Planctomycetota bacterium]